MSNEQSEGMKELSHRYGTWKIYWPKYKIHKCRKQGISSAGKISTGPVGFSDSDEKIGKVLR